jgi:hypothetical protein
MTIGRAFHLSMLKPSGGRKLFKMSKLLMLSALVCGLFALTCPAQPGRWNIRFRDKYLNDLKKCQLSTASYDECNLVTIIDVVILDEKGDPRALPALMDTARIGNVTAADGLSWYFNEMLCDYTQRFLSSVLNRAEPERANLIYLAAVGDSKNLGCLSITSLRQNLQAMSKSENTAFANLAADCLEAVNKYSRPNPNTGDCLVKNFQYKTERQIAMLSSRQLVEEEVQNNIRAPDSISKNFKYRQVTHRYLHRKAVAILPVLTEYMNAYDPTKRARCDEERYSVASNDAGDIDRATIRIRGISEGKLAIAAMERAIARMKAAGFEKPGIQSSLNGSVLDLEQLKGANIRDDEIRDTLLAKHHVEMTDAEFERYVDFLISVDPRYPAWSISEAGYSVRPLLKDSSRFYQAYLKFKRAKQSTFYHGDDLKILREYIKDESVDLIYRDPPPNLN